MLDDTLVVVANDEGVEKFVVGAVIHDDSRALIVTRSDDDDFLPSIEELPSGGVESGETLIEALNRELLEEVGFPADAVDPGFLASFDYKSKSGRLTRQFTVSVPLGTRTVHLSNEHTSFHWISDSETGEGTTTPETRDVLESWFDWMAGR